MVYVEEKVTHQNSTEYFIDGTYDEVLVRYREIEREYPPIAYGTFITRWELYDNETRVKASAKRANSAH